MRRVVGRAKAVAVIGHPGPERRAAVDDPRTDTIRGTSGDDIIRGIAGDDVIFCGDGNDRVDAGAGDDIVRCGRGNDFVLGGDGDDRHPATTG